MNILVLNGSPRANGNTASMVNAFAEGAQQSGHRVEVVSVCQKKIAGCLACEYCHTKGDGRCIQQDDMQQVYPLLQEAEMIVLASPIYYHSFTGQLQCAINRIYALDKPKNLKKAALIMSSGSNHVYCGAIYEYQNSFLNYLKLEDMGIFSAFDKENKSEAKLEELRQFGLQLKQVFLTVFNKQWGGFMKKTGCVLLVGLCAALLTACGFGGSSASDVGSLPAVESNVQQVTEDMQLSETSGSTENNSESSSVEDNTNADITVEKETSDEESEEEAIVQQNTFYVSVGEKVFSATFADNSGAQALKELLADGDITIRMSDYGGFEKVGSLGQSLPTENSQTTTQAGDIVLYQGSQIVIFYGSNSWSYTRLGKIDGLAGWQEALGNGDVAVTLSMQDK